MSNTFTMIRPLRAVKKVVAEDEKPALSIQADEYEKALEKARQEGYEAGKRDAEIAQANMLEQVKAFQSTTLEALADQEGNLFAEAEQALPELILEGVQRIIKEWKPKAKEVEELVREILSGLEGDSGPLRVFLSPAGRKQMLSLHKDLERIFPGVSILEDPELHTGECYARGRFGITDGRFAAKLENLRKVFL